MLECSNISVVVLLPFKFNGFNGERSIARLTLSIMAVGCDERQGRRGLQLLDLDLTKPAVG